MYCFDRLAFRKASNCFNYWLTDYVATASLEISNTITCNFIKLRWSINLFCLSILSKALRVLINLMMVSSAKG